MMYITKIKMRKGCHFSQNLLEIDEVYVTGCNNPGFFKKEVIHNYLKDNPGSIKVGIWPNPNVTPALSPRGEKYIRSAANNYSHDNLLDLPRE